MGRWVKDFFSEFLIQSLRLVYMQQARTHVVGVRGCEHQPPPLPPCFLGKLLQNHAVLYPNSLYIPNIGPKPAFFAVAPLFRIAKIFCTPFQKSAYGPVENALFSRLALTLNALVGYFTIFSSRKQKISCELHSS